ncbi:MAG: chromate transporter [Erysipelotrichaceae bacterium]|nr:chromate transporter [Erysipelotrichaceae bacterium]MDD3924461.1 chromate transporter [Erysipelotrichaceae bacterium]MDD4642854.1 chromate transporter [Erysipelotrichaceae bacterium]
MQNTEKGLLWELFITFFKIGLFTFGGGYAMVAMIESICVKEKEWITHDDMMNVAVIAESTPGPIAINCATFVGYHQANLIGSIVTTLGIILPPFLIIYIVSMFFDVFLEITLIANAFKGIKIAVGLLIFNAAINMIKKMPKKAFSRIIMLSSFVVMLMINILALDLSTITLLSIAAIISLTLFIVEETFIKKKGL